jgi:hypothetical protein
MKYYISWNMAFILFHTPSKLQRAKGERLYHPGTRKLYPQFLANLLSQTHMTTSLESTKQIVTKTEPLQKQRT